MVEKRDKVVLNWRAKRTVSTDVAKLITGNIETAERYFCDQSGVDLQPNQLFWGDNIEVLRYLIAKRVDPVDMIYIDPPFFSGGKFSIRAPGGNFPRAYKDTWHDGLAQYLDYMHERLVLMHALLRDGGSMYVHLDWHVFHYVKVLLDEIFGYENFRNQIIWKRLTYKQTQVKAYGVLHDVILFYTKGKDYTWNDVRAGYGEERLKKYFCWLETPDGKNIKLTRDQLEGKSPIPEGRRFALNPIINPNPNRPNLTYEFLGFKKVWKYTEDKMREYHARGQVFQPSPGALPQKKQYLDESNGMKLNDLFLDIGGVMGSSNERLDFDTQKPLKLLERLIQVSTNPGDTVADFFSGSGTTLDAAEGLGRKWIGCELARPGINATRKRLISRRSSMIQNKSKKNGQYHAPFEVRKVVSAAELAWLRNPRDHARAMLALYGAEAVESAEYGRGKKDGKLVVVMPPTASINAGSVQMMINDVLGKTRDVVGVDILARDWALGLGENPSSFSRPGFDVRLVQIPSTSEIVALLVGTGMSIDDLLQHEVPPAIQAAVPFHALPDIIISQKLQKGKLELVLDGYRCNNRCFGEVRSKPGDDSFAVVDFMGIDWDHDGQVFACSDALVQSRKSPAVTFRFSHQYHVQGPHQVMVRIVDAFGNDSSRFGQFDVII
ncbi:MAG: site-specific DNA-methyltransferase [Candidatus Sigynarchaeota archaeon]